MTYRLLLEKKYFGTNKGKFGKKDGKEVGKGGGGGRGEDKGGFGVFGGRGGGRGDDRGGFGGKRKGSSSESFSGAKRFKQDDSAGGRGGGNNKKRFNTGLKSNDQIMKERNRKRKVQDFQANRKKGDHGSKADGGPGRGWKPFNKRR
jgi:hypothetical protein